jgi:hypothetical protein
MAIVITLVVSYCSGVSQQDIRSKLAELHKQHPEAKVSVRLDKKCLN